MSKWRIVEDYRKGFFHIFHVQKRSWFLFIIPVWLDCRHFDHLEDAKDYIKRSKDSEIRHIRVVHEE